MLERRRQHEEQELEKVSQYARPRRNARGRSVEPRESSVDPERRAIVDSAREAAQRRLEEQRRREQELLHRQTYEMNRDIKVLQGAVVSENVEVKKPVKHGRKFLLLKGLLKRQR
jgi:hypothetical protein